MAKKYIELTIAYDPDTPEVRVLEVSKREKVEDGAWSGLETEDYAERSTIYTNEVCIDLELLVPAPEEPV